jgi:hypothetical protein
MTAEQEIKAEIIRQAIETGEFTHEGEVTVDNVNALWDELSEDGDDQDARSEFRQSGEETGLECQYSRHYESEAVARQLSNGKWVGWTYWHGGGKHSDPDSIDWMEEAYFLNVVEEEKMVTVRTFSKQD